MKRNNVMLHTITKIVTFIILAFSVYLFFAGHNNPGGGFIGGLMTVSALLLMYVSFDRKTVDYIIRINFPNLIAVGLLISMGTGIVSMLFGDAYLTQYFDYFQLPILGETELTTALPFDLGIYMVVVGVAMLTILTIRGDA
ncbi:Na(+)/H(+) antiporter subunit B [Desulfuribacillus alkaliarsenatis]|uniref:Na(+)/H(+) antiporter subunit B n=1 Tax=Desulfuribacillus alkaliarsenatis TaxID=766136 RepID=A0A1E5G0G5_9FIRM|nr:Na(+)/H(+) antiporter subunit B [Desulfuribacillus alkaliarsenatis]OEF96326.1 Na(+)/H(+) antiporter subunit B [Desulfuribacillus alkaliarsenatis]